LDGGDVKSDSTVVTEAALGFRDGDNGADFGAFGNHDDAVNQDGVQDFEFDGIVDAGGGGRESFQELEANGRFVGKNEAGKRRIGRGRSGNRRTVVGDAFASGRGLCGSGGGGAIFENCGTRHGHESGFALGGADRQVGIIAANDLNNFAALQGGADV